MQVGLGVDVASIRQFRDKFLDIPFRHDMGKFGYHEVMFHAGMEVQTVFAEMEGQYKMQSVLSDMWSAIHELDMNPTTIETRANFIEMCKVLIDKFDKAYHDMYQYQLNLNEQIKHQVQQVNILVARIEKLNIRIASEETFGSNANDYRDARNVALDDLSKILDITYREMPNKMVIIQVEGKDLLSEGVRNTLGLRYTSPQWPFVEPVFTTKSSILSYDPRPSSLDDCLFDPRRQVNSNIDNDRGSLKALLVARGNKPATHMSSAGQVRDRMEGPPPSAAELFAGTVYIGPTLVGPNGQTFLASGTDTFFLDFSYDEITGVMTIRDGTVTTRHSLGGHYQTPVTCPYTNQTVTYSYRNGVTNNPQYYRDLWDMQSGFIPRVQMQLDTMFNQIIKMINDTISPPEVHFIEIDLETMSTVDPPIGEIPGGVIVTGASQNRIWAIPIYYVDEDGNVDRNVILEYQAAPYDLAMNQPMLEVFQRNAPKYADRYDYFDSSDLVNPLAAGRREPPQVGDVMMSKPEDFEVYSSQYTIGNVRMNLAFADTTGYTKVAVAMTREIHGKTVLENILQDWNRAIIGIDDNEKLTIQEFYQWLIAIDIATDIQESHQFVQAQVVLLEEHEYRRQAMSGVSMDEEMTFMMKYQHAYNAASRIANYMDEMLDRIINRMGRVGL
jgi:flagellar hook-associated protein FlgK